MQQRLSITELLGGPAVLGRRIAKPGQLVEAVRAGVPYKAFDTVREAAGLSLEEAGALLGIPSRTLARRKRGGRLTVGESDRVYRLAHFMARALEVFGDRDKVARWLRKPNRALGNLVPLSRLDTEAGTREIEAVLGRIEHGVFS
jgi:putative toxin-antitoxin system antitoxin component (TIGR02293 family)